MNDLANISLGQFQVLEVIGRGNTATVYKAYHPSLNRHVAIKVLLNHLHPQFKARFRREAQSIAQLQHPNILPIYDFVQQDDLDYFVMQYVDGASTLNEQLAHAPLPVADVLTITVYLLDALDYAHGRGIIHRDVKPANILMLRPDWPLLADFGIAKLLDDSMHLTPVGQMIGTAAYMAPEQISENPIDARSDLYSAGVVLYEMATGHVPFEAPTPLAVLMKHVNSPLPPPRSLNPALPAEVETIIVRALAKEPDARFQSASEMRAATRAALTQVERGTGQRPVTRPAVPRAPLLPMPVPQAASRSEPAVLASAATQALEPAQPPVAVPASTTDSQALPRSTASLPRRRTIRTLLLLLAMLVLALAGLSMLPRLLGAPALPVDVQATPNAAIGQPSPVPMAAVVTALPSITAAAPALPPPGLAASPAPGETYVVQIGDTLSSLAERFNTSVEALLAANGLSNPDAIEAGQVLNIPGAGELPVPTSSSATSAPTLGTATATPPVETLPLRVVLDDSAWSGGFRQAEGQTYGGRTATWVYGYATEFSVMRASFEVVAPPTTAMLLRIEGMDSEGNDKTPIRITLNATEIYNGPNPLPDDDLPLETGTWATADVPFDPALLQPGLNEIAISNQAEGAYSRPPFFMLDYAEVRQAEDSPQFALLQTTISPATPVASIMPTFTPRPTVLIVNSPTSPDGPTSMSDRGATTGRLIALVVALATAAGLTAAVLVTRRRGG